MPKMTEFEEILQQAKAEAIREEKSNPEHAIEILRTADAQIRVQFKFLKVPDDLSQEELKALSEMMRQNTEYADNIETNIRVKEMLGDLKKEKGLIPEIEESLEKNKPTK